MPIDNNVITGCGVYQKAVEHLQMKKCSSVLFDASLSNIYLLLLYLLCNKWPVARYGIALAPVTNEKRDYLICLCSQPYSENILLRLVSMQTGTHSYSVGQDPLSLATDNWGLWYPNLLSIQHMRMYKTCFRHEHLFVELRKFKYSLMHGYGRGREA